MVLAYQSTPEATHHRDRQRHPAAANSVIDRIARVGLPAQRLRKQASMLLTWVRLSLPVRAGSTPCAHRSRSTKRPRCSSRERRCATAELSSRASAPRGLSGCWKSVGLRGEPALRQRQGAIRALGRAGTLAGAVMGEVFDFEQARRERQANSPTHELSSTQPDVSVHPDPLAGRTERRSGRRIGEDGRRAARRVRPLPVSGSHASST